MKTRASLGLDLLLLDEGASPRPNPMSLGAAEPLESPPRAAYRRPGVRVERGVAAEEFADMRCDGFDVSSGHDWLDVRVAPRD